MDKVVAAAIRKYEDYDKSPSSSLRKTRTTPGRTKSGSSASEQKKKAYANTSEERGYSKKKGRKKSTTNENSTEQQDQQQQTRARLPLESESRDSSTHSGSAHIDAAGAIAVYPSDSNHATTRLDRSSAPHRISVAGNFLTSSEFNQIRDTTDEEEVSVLPPESQIIDAVVTYRNPNQRQESATVSNMDTLTTAPTVASSVVRDSESGTVTARAVSSENYYQEVRRQLQKEAVAAVAVVALHEDESIHNNKKRSKSTNDIEMQNTNNNNAEKGKG